MKIAKTACRGGKMGGKLPTIRRKMDKATKSKKGNSPFNHFLQYIN